MSNVNNSGISVKAGVALAACASMAGCVGSTAADSRRTATEAMNPYVATVLAANRAMQPFPPASQVMPTLSEKAAYRLQAQLVAAQLARDRIDGFKAGMMKPEQQRSYQTAPFFGVLLASGARTAPTELRLRDFRQIILETELGYEFSQSIAKPISDVAALRPLVKRVRPTVEAGDKAFTSGAALNGRDFIAANVGSSHFVRGPGLDLANLGLDLNQVKPRLYRDGELVSEGIGTDSLGDQWTALLYLVNEIVAEGYAIQPGQIIITGSLGAVYAGGAGDYRADYGPLGELRFTVVP